MMMQALSRRNVLLAFGAALASRAAFAQGVPSDKESTARLAAQGWLVLLDRKDWGRAWETTAGAFRAKVPLEQAVKEAIEAGRKYMRAGSADLA